MLAAQFEGPGRDPPSRLPDGELHPCSAFVPTTASSALLHLRDCIPFTRPILCVSLVPGRPGASPWRRRQRRRSADGVLPHSGDRPTEKRTGARDCSRRWTSRCSAPKPARAYLKVRAGPPTLRDASAADALRVKDGPSRRRAPGAGVVGTSVRAREAEAVLNRRTRERPELPQPRPMPRSVIRSTFSPAPRSSRSRPAHHRPGPADVSGEAPS